MYQDSIGSIWFATDRGISRYDGQFFLTINTDSYFTSGVFNFFEESKSKVWVSTVENELFWFNPLDLNFEFHPYIYNSILTATFKSIPRATFIRNVVFYNTDCKVTFLKKSGHISIKNGIGTLYKSQYKIKNINNSNLYINVDSSFVYSEFKSNKPNTGGLYLIYKGKETLITSEFSYNSHQIHGISSQTSYTDEYYYSIGHYLIKIKDSKVFFTELPNEILRINASENSLIIGTFKGAYQLDRNLEITNVILDDYTITDIQVDDTNEYWFSTTDNGVYYTSNIDFLRLKHSERMKPNYLFTMANKLFFIQKNNLLYIYSKQGEHLNIFSKTSEHNNIINSEHDLSTILGSPSIYSYLNKAYSYLNNIDNKYVTVKQKNAKVISSHKLLFIPKLLNNQKIKGTLFVNDTSYIIRTVNKLYLYDVTYKKYNEIPIENTTALNKINNTILISTKNKTYSLNSNQLKPLNLQSKFNKIYVQNDSIFWTYGYQGLNKIYYKDSILKSTSITIEDGLPTNEITSLTSDEQFLWVGSKKGILKLDINYTPRIKKLQKERFVIDSITVDLNIVNTHSELTATEESVLKLHFKYIQYSSPNPIKFEYQINQSNWLDCNPNLLILQSLKTGKHTLKIRQKNSPHPFYNI